jgi:hypothetical protein
LKYSLTHLMPLCLAGAFALPSCSAHPHGSSGASDTRIKVGTAPSAVELADFNQDGKLDAAVANSESDNVTILLGDGTGGFKASAGSPFPAGNEPNDLAIGDINNDGNLDLAFANHDTTYLTVLVGDGKGGFKPALVRHSPSRVNRTLTASSPPTSMATVGLTWRRTTGATIASPSS